MQFKKTAAFLAAFSLLCTAAPSAPFVWTDRAAISASAMAVDADVLKFLGNSITEGTNYLLVGEGQTVDTMQMSGRSYFSGVQITSAWGKNAGITLDVSGCKTLSFTIGHVDNCEGSTTNTVKITLDGEEFTSIALSAADPLHEISLPVDGISTAEISFSSSSYDEGVFGIAGLKTDTFDASTAYGLASYEKCTDIPACVYNLENGKYFLAEGTDKLVMSGRTFGSGVCADLTWSKGSSFGLCVEGLDSLSFTFGHVDDTGSGDSKLEIYLDGNLYNTYDLTERMALQSVELPLKKRFTSAVFILSDTGNGDASYGFGDFKANTSTDAPVDTAPTYQTGLDIAGAAFDQKNCTVYPIDNGSYADAVYLQMCGRSYANGLTMNAKWNTDAGFGINTENADELTFTVGHADGLPGGSSQLHIYLDGQEYKLLGDILLTDNMPLKTITLPVKKVQSVQLVVDKTGNSDASYGFADFCTTTAKDAEPYTTAECKTGQDIVDFAFNGRNTVVYPIESENLFDDPEMLNMNGRTYADGLVLTPKWNATASVGINTDEFDKLTFTVGHADDKNINGSDSKLHIYFDGEEADISPIELTENMPLKQVELDVADVQSVVLLADQCSTTQSFGIADLIAEKDGKVAAADAEAFTAPEYTDEKSIIDRLYNLNDCERFVNHAGEYELPETFKVGGIEYTEGIMAKAKWNSAAWFGINTDHAGQITCKVGHPEDAVALDATLNVYIDGEAYAPYSQMALTPDMKQTELTIPADKAQCIVIEVSSSATVPYAFTDFAFSEAAPALDPGDLTGDAEISAEDAQITIRAYVNMLAGKDSGLSDAQKQAADVDGDGEITAADAQIILKYYVETLAGKNPTWESVQPKKK